MSIRYLDKKNYNFKNLINKSDYTTQARSFALKFPLLTFILIQINYWVIAFLLLVVVMYFNGKTLVEMNSLDIPILFLPSFWTAIIGGIVYGTSLGFLDWWFDRGLSRRLSLGLTVLIKAALYFLVLIALFSFIRLVLWEGIFLGYFYDLSDFAFTDAGWRYGFYLFGIYSLMLGIGISFINQMNKMFGPGVLLPILFGKFQNPQEQERLFMLIDMKSSTTHAEFLGHERYSRLIQDYFQDINRVLFYYRAEIYQYVGDEIVVSWLKTDTLQAVKCLDFFYSCQEVFVSKTDFYQKKYGLVPQFKAGAHIGKIIAVEVGDIKREIAYHGDTLNTAARIQGVCNQYDKDFLISSELAEVVGPQTNYAVSFLGELELKGKKSLTRLYSVEKKLA